MPIQGNNQTGSGGHDEVERISNNERSPANANAVVGETSDLENITQQAPGMAAAEGMPRNSKDATTMSEADWNRAVKEEALKVPLSTCRRPENPSNNLGSTDVKTLTTMSEADWNRAVKEEELKVPLSTCRRPEQATTAKSLAAGKGQTTMTESDWNRAVKEEELKVPLSTCRRPATNANGGVLAVGGKNHSTMSEADWTRAVEEESLKVPLPACRRPGQSTGSAMGKNPTTMSEADWNRAVKEEELKVPLSTCRRPDNATDNGKASLVQDPTNNQPHPSARLSQADWDRAVKEESLKVASPAVYAVPAASPGVMQSPALQIEGRDAKGNTYSSPHPTTGFTVDSTSNHAGKLCQQDIDGEHLQSPTPLSRAASAAPPSDMTYTTHGPTSDMTYMTFATMFPAPPPIEPRPSDSSSRPRQPSQPGAYAQGLSQNEPQYRAPPAYQSFTTADGGSTIAPLSLPLEELNDEAVEGEPTATANSIGNDVENLVTANPVQEEANPELPAARTFDQKRQSIQLLKEKERFLKLLALAFILVVIVSLAVGIGVGIGASNDNTSIEVVPIGTNSPTPAPSIAPPTSVEDALLQFLPASTKELLSSPDSPQARAYQWIFNDPKKETYPSWRLVQRFALATLYYSTNGDTNWFNNSLWLSYEHHECNWFSGGFSELIKKSNGVRLNINSGEPCLSSRTNSSVDEKYRHLWLSNNGLSGTLPDEIFLLTSLHVLAPYANQEMTGTISSLIGNLRQLEGLALGYSDLRGSLPSEVFALPKLETLLLSRSLLNGPIPTEIGSQQQPSLKYVWFDFNSFSGTVPTEVGSATSLESIALHNNSLSGKVVSELGAIGSLEELYLHNNGFNGTLATELGQLPLLNLLYLNANQLTGSLPSELGNMDAMERLILRDNQLQGSVPSEIGRLSASLALSIAGNHLTGMVPAEIGTLTQLTRLQLQENQLSGTLASEIGYLTQMKILLLNNNNISGSLPPQLGQLTLLEEFSVASNEMTGTIPAEIGLLANESVPEQTVNISGNAFTGRMPQGLCGVATLDFDCGADAMCGCTCECAA